MQIQIWISCHTPLSDISGVIQIVWYSAAMYKFGVVTIIAPSISLMATYSPHCLKYTIIARIISWGGYDRKDQKIEAVLFIRRSV